MKTKKSYIERFKKTIEKLEDVNDNFHIGGQQYGRIDAVIDELKALYEEAKVLELSLGQIVYVEFDKGSTHIGVVVKIKDSRSFCGIPTIKYYDIDMDAIHETSLENVYPSLISLFEGKLKRMEEEKNKYIEDYATKTIEIRNTIKKLQENEE